MYIIFEIINIHANLLGESHKTCQKLAHIISYPKMNRTK